MKICKMNACLVLGLVLLSFSHAQDCDDTGKSDDEKEFPDINKESDLSYQLSVQLTVTNEKVQQTSYFKEYRDILNSKGRVDDISAGNTTNFYYFKESNETFEVKGDTCTSLTMQAIPIFMKEGVTEWQYKDDVRGPSAMILNALDIWKTDRKNIFYMGEATIRGLKAQYWRRCKGKQTIDYYFTADDHDDVYGFKDLKQIPLRVNFSASEQDSDFFPQTYDIMSFQPFVSEKASTLAVPAGIGCRRSAQLKDVPTVPDFSDSNMMVFGEAVYISSSSNVKWNYYSTFMFALDVLTDHMAYFYTPWSGENNTEQTADGFVHISYDTKNKYVYKNNLANDTCEISRESKYYPRYYLPRNGGYIDLTDPMVLFPNNEFRYVSENKDRGYDVYTFEAVMTDYSLGTRTVPKVIVTHSYLRDNQIIDNVVEVRNTSISIQFKIFTNKDMPHSELLTLNLFGFSTRVEHPQYVFSVASCMKNDDQYLYVTIGFAADQKVRDKIQTEIPSIQDNILQAVIRASELNPLRVPYIFVDFDDMIYATLMILDKPPLYLDFPDVEEGKTLTGSVKSEGVVSLDGCATLCLESDVKCWGFAFCGTLCTYAAGDDVTVTKGPDCKLYRRFDNDTYVKSKESAANTLKKLVNLKQLKIAVPNIEDSSAMPEFLEASYFSIKASGESEEIFGLLGKQTNPRLRVVRPGYKLVDTGEKVKNFGKIRYDECQRMCLDYRRCETVSYCVKDSQCVLSLTYAEDLPEKSMKPDNFCNLLAKKYEDHFDRSLGSVLSQTAKLVIPTTNPEDCARTCVKERDFECLSFDLCPDSETEGCRLHATHLLDVDKEDGVTREISCGHYSKKFSYNYKKEDNKQSLKVGFLAATNITLEQCARMCDQLETDICYGFDFCGDRSVTSTSCYILNDDPSNYKTTYSAICTHFIQRASYSPGEYSKGNAAWVGVVTFFVAVLVGILVTFGVGYYRANRAAR